MIVEAAETFLRRREESKQLLNGVSRHSNAINGVNGAYSTKGSHSTKGINGINGMSGVDGINDMNGVNGGSSVNGYHHVDESGDQISKTDLHSSTISHLNTASVVNNTADTQKHLLVFAAHNELTLKNNIKAFQETCKQWPLSDLAYTLSARRNGLPVRYTIIATDDKMQHDIDPEKVVGKNRFESQQLRLGFVFTGEQYSDRQFNAASYNAKFHLGQGAQWPQMGLDLLMKFPCYLATIRQLDEFLRRTEDPPAWTLEGNTIFSHRGGLLSLNLSRYHTNR